MNDNTLFTTLLTLLVTAFAIGCGPVDEESWDYESGQAAFNAASDDDTDLDYREFSLTEGAIDRAEAPVTGDIRQWVAIANWKSARLGEEKKKVVIEDNWAEREIQRIEDEPEVEGEREAAEDVLLIDLELLEDDLFEEDEVDE